MKESIIMTVADRDTVLLLSVLRALACDPLEDTEIIIVDDCSTIDYEPLVAGMGTENVRLVKMDPYEAFQMGENKNYGNPAKAFNRGLMEAKGEYVAIMSSDTIVPPRVLQAARKFRGENVVYCPMCIDLFSGMEYCGPHRTFPMPWFLYCRRDACIEAGGWDENYMMGLCWEDNDFLGRLALTTDGIVFDWSCIVWHHSHPQPAYDIDNIWIKNANDRNRLYTMDKWASGMPFGDPDLVWCQINRGRHESGMLMWTFKDIKGVLGKVKLDTLSPFVEQKAVVEETA